MAGIPKQIVIVAFVLEALFVTALKVAPDVVTTVPVLLLAGAAWIAGVYFILARRPSSPRLLQFIIAAAIVFRATVWMLNAPFTDDLYRYRWEGKLQAAGGNPYASRPADAAWRSLRDETYPKVGGKDVKAVYGPGTELITRLLYQWLERFDLSPEQETFWFKLPAALADLGVLAALLSLLELRGMAKELVLVYAWSPLPIWEFWASGHNDAMLVLALLLALVASVKLRVDLAGVALGAAVAFKLWPVLLFPALLKSVGSIRPIWSGLAVAVACALPYWTGVSENLRFATGFAGSWRNNDSLFGLVLYLVGDPETTKAVVLILIAAGSLAIAMQRWPVEHKFLFTAVWILVLSANCHPWYLTWMLPFLAFEVKPALLLWIALVPLSYKAWIDWSLLGEWDGSTPWRWLIYVPVLIVVLAKPASDNRACD